MTNHHPSFGSGATSSTAFLANGMQVVVLPDHRSPIVTHMVWYRNGSADDPQGKSGIGHFLEHLMFKGTGAHPAGDFSERVASVGGRENAFTSLDYTAYFQRVPRDHLAMCMAYEADRMKNLVFSDEVIGPERDVVLEERRMRTDSDPAQILDEIVASTAFSSHPYGKPVIGWQHEIETLGRADAMAYYDRFYTPENALLLVAGDVTHDDVMALAQIHYGHLAPLGTAPKRSRPQEPSPRARRQVVLADSRVTMARLQRLHLVPSYATARPGEAEALEVLAHVLGGGPTSILVEALVLNSKVAVSIGCSYWGTAIDASRFVFAGVPVEGVSPESLDVAIDAIVAKLTADGIDPDAVERSKIQLTAATVFAQDSQERLARWFGASLVTGLTPEHLKTWADRIDSVSPADLMGALRCLDRNTCVSGYLSPLQIAA